MWTEEPAAATRTEITAMLDAFPRASPVPHSSCGDLAFSWPHTILRVGRSRTIARPLPQAVTVMENSR